MKEELCKRHCFVPVLKQRLMHRKCTTSPKCPLLWFGGKASRVTSSQSWLIFNPPWYKAHLSTLQKYHWDMTNLAGYIPNWESRAYIWIVWASSNLNKKDLKKITFFPSQQSIPNHFSLLVNFYSRVHLGYWNRSLQYLIYYTPRVIALLRPNSLPLALNSVWLLPSHSHLSRPSIYLST